MNENRLLYFFERKVRDHMTTDVVSVTPSHRLRDLGELIERHDFNAFPVLDGGKLVGVITKFDFMRAFAFTEAHPIPHYDTLMDTPVRSSMREALVTVSPETPLTRVLQQMVELKVRSFPVVAGERLVGMISREDIIKALNESVGRA